MAFEFPKVQAIPGFDGASLRIGGRERVGYRFASEGARPFFYPILGRPGTSLTRIGHPNPVGHEHHKSVWFGHESIAGVNFWSERPDDDARLRHRRVLWYEDGPDWAAFAAEIDWEAGGRVLLRQSLIAALEPTPEGTAFDLQCRFTTPDGAPVSLGKTNFGFLGVRLAKTISEQFGGGRLTGSEGSTGEDELFGTRNRWVDYSGPSAPGLTEGICYLDHPDNPRHPSHWHVRRDGWMSAAFCLAEPYGVAADHPLDLRYRLLLHPGSADPAALDRAWDRFGETPAYEFVPQERGRFPTIARG